MYSNAIGHLAGKRVDLLIREQAEFVAWWDASVQRPGRRWDNSPRSALIIPADIAEEQTGIPHQRVPRWRRRLGDVAQYRGGAAVIGAAGSTALA